MTEVGAEEKCLARLQSHSLSGVETLMVYCLVLLISHPAGPEYLPTSTTVI